jgi:hypothetical protein
LGQVLRGPRSLAEIKALDPDLNQAVCHMLDLPEEFVVEAAKALYDKSQSTIRPRNNQP